MLKGPRYGTADQHVRVELGDAFGSRDKPRFIDADLATASLSIPLYTNQKKTPGYVQEG